MTRKNSIRFGGRAALAAPLLVAAMSLTHAAIGAPPAKGAAASAVVSAAPGRAGGEESAFEAAVRIATEKELAASRAEYKKKLDEMRETRAVRKREQLEEAQFRYRRVLHAPGFDEELRVHAERLARLRRVGGLAVAEGRGYDVRMQVLALIMRELDRHRAVVRDLEKKGKEAP